MFVCYFTSDMLIILYDGNSLFYILLKPLLVDVSARPPRVASRDVVSRHAAAGYAQSPY